MSDYLDWTPPLSTDAPERTPLAWARIVAEKNERIAALEQERSMPCGHAQRMAVHSADFLGDDPGEIGTSYCGECERIAALEQERDIFQDTVKKLVALEQGQREDAIRIAGLKSDKRTLEQENRSSEAEIDGLNESLMNEIERSTKAEAEVERLRAAIDRIYHLTTDCALGDDPESFYRGQLREAVGIAARALTKPEGE